MKKCPNPECLSYEQNRTFYDDDTICPRCGEVLVNPSLSGAGPDPVAPTTYVVAAQPVAASASVTNMLAALGAIGTLVLVFLIVGFLLTLGRAVGVVGRGVSQLGPTIVVPTVSGPQALATAHAQQTAEAMLTPIGGLIGATSVPNFGVQSVPTLPPLPQLGGGGVVSAANPAGAASPP